MTLGIKVAIIGLKRFATDMSLANVRFGTELERNTERAAILVEGAAQRRIRGSRTRSKFMIRGGKRVRRGSRRGSRRGAGGRFKALTRPITAKSNETGIFEGRLRQSASHKIIRRLRSVDAEVGFGTVYAKRQERKRSFLGVAIDKNRNRIFKLIGKTFKVLR